MVFISHDLAVVRSVCDRIAVMYLGRIVEVGTCDDIFERPEHPYTRGLLAAAPRIGTANLDSQPALRGEVPSALAVPPGCRFHTRCGLATDQCRDGEPPVVVQNTHEVAQSLDAAAPRDISWTTKRL